MMWDDTFPVKAFERFLKGLKDKETMTPTRTETLRLKKQAQRAKQTPEQREARNARERARYRALHPEEVSEERAPREKTSAKRPWHQIQGSETGRGNWIEARRHTFIAVDGGDGLHGLMFLRSSTHTEVIPVRPSRRLETGRCLDFLLFCSHPGEVVVTTRLGYLVEHWLRDLAKHQAEDLTEDGSCSLFVNGRHLRVEYIPGKQLRVADHGMDLTTSGKPPKKTVTVYDVSELVIDPARYNSDNLQDLKVEMERLDQSLLNQGICPSGWGGPGYLASPLLRREKMKAHREDLPPAVEEAARYAYFGGRNVCHRVGVIEGPVYKADIRSAYTAAMVGLPSLSEGTWRHSSVRGKSIVNDLGVYRVSWDLGDGTNRKNPHWPLNPFPWRRGPDRGLLEHSLCYPPHGEGWYWGSLVRLAKEYWGGKIKIHEGWVLKPATDVKPFAFLRDLYEARRVAREAGSDDAWALKLILSACYGKLCQRKGWGDRQPSWRSYAWAGMVTAQCQAWVLEALLMSPKKAIASCTDAIITSATPILPSAIGEGLGEWEVCVADRFQIHGYGVYQGWCGNGVPNPDMAGRMGFKDELDWPELERRWRLDPHCSAGVAMVEKRLVTARQALAEGDVHRRCQWRDVVIEQPLSPKGQELVFPPTGRDWAWLNSWHRAEEWTGWEMSMPYSPDVSIIDSRWGMEGIIEKSILD